MLLTDDVFEAGKTAALLSRLLTQTLPRMLFWLPRGSTSLTRGFQVSGWVSCHHGVEEQEACGFFQLVKRCLKHTIQVSENRYVKHDCIASMIGDVKWKRQQPELFKFMLVQVPAREV